MGRNHVFVRAESYQHRCVRTVLMLYSPAGNNLSPMRNSNGMLATTFWLSSCANADPTAIRIIASRGTIFRRFILPPPLHRGRPLSSYVSKQLAEAFQPQLPD